MRLHFQHVKARGCSSSCESAEAESQRLVRLMGPSKGLPAPLIYRKGWALLGYLAVESNRMHSRASLAALLWPNLGESSALTNLRQVLSNLNRFCTLALGPDTLRIERLAVGLMRDEKPLFDIDLLKRSPCQSVHLLNGHAVFMDGMEDVADSCFQSWLESTRQELQGRLIGAAEKCCDALLDGEQWERASELARTLCRHDPWNEANARRLMRAHAGSGMRAAAIKEYQRLEAQLRSELGLYPARETRRLFEQLAGTSAVPGSWRGMAVPLPA